MAAQIAAPIRVILLDLMAQIVTLTGFDPSRVVLARAEKEVPFLNAEQDVVIRVWGEAQDPDPDRGGRGRVALLMKRIVKVEVRSRNYLDDVMQEVVRLTDPVYGHTVLEDMLVDACEAFMALDDSQNQLSLYGWVGPLSEAREDKTETDWITSSFELHIPYQRVLDQTRQ